MAEDFSELVTYLDGKFNKVDERFIGLERRIENIESTMVTKEDFNNLQTAVDKYAEKADAYFQEMLMLSNKIDRHEKWLHQLADKLGIKLQY